jgi:hypothetical protein
MDRSKVRETGENTVRDTEDGNEREREEEGRGGRKNNVFIKEKILYIYKIHICIIV